MEPLKFLSTKGKKVMCWQTWRDHNIVHVEHWQHGSDKRQQTEEVFSAVNVGKSNEKEDIDVAQEAMERKIKTKTDAGYEEVEAFDYVPEEGVEETFDFDNPQRNAAPYKPQNICSGHLVKLMGAGLALFVRKRDGNAMFTVCDSKGDFKMVTSKMAQTQKDEDVPWLQRFPAIHQDLLDLEIPPRSLILGEIVAHRVVDSRNYVSRVMRSKHDIAVDLMKRFGELHYVVWDIAYWNGENLFDNVAVADRFNLMQQLNTEHISTPEILEAGVEVETDNGVVVFDGSPEKAIEFAKAAGWEGFVVVDPDATYAGSGITFAGKATRPKECGKLKPTYEADFIVRWDPDNGIGSYGKGKKSVGIGAVFLYLIDGDKEVFISECGGGLSIAEKVDKTTGEVIVPDIVKYANPALYPMVWQVEFQAITEHGSLDFPNFVRARFDKSTVECTFDQLENIPRREAFDDE